MTTPFLELRAIGKSFAGVRALDGVSLAIETGEIHCLAGENGSGKSTLIKIVSGVNQPDGGEILFDGIAAGGMTPRHAIAHGVQVIYQDFSLFRNLSVAENLGIGSELREQQRVVSHARIRRNAEAAMARLGVHLPLDDAVETLPTAGRQLVAIARALTASPRLLIMDEPTTALTGREIETLFSVVRDIQARGISVLFVSHKMREMLDIAERITIIRNGRVVSTGAIRDYDERSITHAMTGLDIPVEPYRWQQRSPAATPVLEVEGLTVPGELEDVGFSVMPGEIVGVSGLLGSGRTELALALFGMRPAYRGAIRIDGKAVALREVPDAIAQGIAYVPEDRLTEGLFMPQTIDRNIIASSLGRLSRFGMLRLREAARVAAQTIQTLAIATPTGN
ncbi:MAG: sugar ABC transporter ATP-binding protein, partial [Janthinobacterium lividum]